MENKTDDTKATAYEAPMITDIASVHELTLDRRGHKRKHHAFDGVTRANRPNFGMS